MQLTPREKRILQIAGVVLPLFLIVYFFVLRPDGGEDLAAPSGASTVAGPTGAIDESPSVSPSPTPRQTLPPVSLAGDRDPFSIPPGLAITGGSVGPTTTIPSQTGGTTTAPVTTLPPTTVTPPPFTTPPFTSTTTSPPPPPDMAANKILIGGHNVKLIKIAGNEKTLDVKVDGKVYTVEPGATFDDNFRLVRIDGTCARFLFGDQSFELCEK